MMRSSPAAFGTYPVDGDRLPPERDGAERKEIVRPDVLHSRKRRESILEPLVERDDRVRIVVLEAGKCDPDRKNVRGIEPGFAFVMR
jgi:hypothetical protein